MLGGFLSATSLRLHNSKGKVRYGLTRDVLCLRQCLPPQPLKSFHFIGYGVFVALALDTKTPHTWPFYGHLLRCFGYQALPPRYSHHSPLEVSSFGTYIGSPEGATKTL